MKIKLWGTRGSIPTPSTGSFQTTRYGGDTTCFAIETADQFIIIDSGTGIRLLGFELLKQQRKHATFFFTHMHWDHIQGFPFFSPIYSRDFSFDLYGLPRSGDSPSLEDSLKRQQEGDKFPVPFQNIPSTLNFHSITPGQSITLNGASSKIIVTAEKLNHPGGCLGYRIEEFRNHKIVASIAIATDTEHFQEPNPNLQKLAQNADILIYDAQYTEEEYSTSKKGWGHSTWKHGLIEAQAAKVKCLLLTHHDPLHDDSFISKLESEAQNFSQNTEIQVFAATQLQEFFL